MGLYSDLTDEGCLVSLLQRRRRQAMGELWHLPRRKDCDCQISCRFGSSVGTRCAASPGLRRVSAASWLGLCSAPSLLRHEWGNPVGGRQRRVKLLFPGEARWSDRLPTLTVASYRLIKLGVLVRVCAEHFTRRDLHLGQFGHLEHEWRSEWVSDGKEKKKWGWCLWASDLLFLFSPGSFLLLQPLLFVHLGETKMDVRKVHSVSVSPVISQTLWTSLQLFHPRRLIPPWTNHSYVANKD